jgi:hypothetical protein
LASLAWAFGSVEPVGQHEQAENHEHDDENVFDFHGLPFGLCQWLKKFDVIMQR